MLLSMTVMMPREEWTDGRLDDLAARVEKGFEEVKGEIRDLRVETNGLRSEMNTRFEGVQRTMIIGFVTLFASIVGSVIAGMVTMG
jgi:hypothetical protein